MLSQVQDFRKSNHIKSAILVWLYFILIFFYTRHVPLTKFSVLMNIALIGLFSLSFKEIVSRLVRFDKWDKLFFVIITGYLLVGIVYSLFLENTFSLIFRFFLLLLFIVLAYFITLPKKIIAIFIWLNALQALVVIGLALTLAIFFSPKEALVVRFFFMDQNWGDIYSLNGWLYIVQIKGNGLLPVAFFITYFYKLRFTFFLRCLLLIGCIIAGNFAFLISIAFFLLFFFLKSKSAEMLFRKLFVLLACGLIFTYPVYEYYVKDVLELKKQGSLGTRWDQVSVLLDDLTKTTSSTVLGQGIGHTVEVITPLRDYRGNFFFEVQTIYILNQLGVLGFLIFTLYNIRLAFLNYKKEGLILIYISYIIYSFTNPYIFDTGHIAVILLLNSLNSNEG